MLMIAAPRPAVGEEMPRHMPAPVRQRLLLDPAARKVLPDRYEHPKVSGSEQPGLLHVRAAQRDRVSAAGHLGLISSPALPASSAP
jgi:hypothetical protein